MNRVQYIHIISASGKNGETHHVAQSWIGAEPANPLSERVERVRPSAIM